MEKLFKWTLQGYYFTDLGKISVGGLSLSKFNAVQEPLILSELDRLTNLVEITRADAGAHAGACRQRFALARLSRACQSSIVGLPKAISEKLLEEKLADLKIYKLQLQRILRFTLYFLQIKCDGKTLHKIGVTSRDISDKPNGMASHRISEIERDLKQYYSQIDINVLGTWQHRGNLELYFKHRYKKFNYPIGKLTEYYKFKDVNAVLDDLCSMPPKVLKGAELEIW